MQFACRAPDAFKRCRQARRAASTGQSCERRRGRAGGSACHIPDTAANVARLYRTEHTLRPQTPASAGGGNVVAAELAPAGQGTTAPHLRLSSVNPWVMAGAAALIAVGWGYAALSIWSDHRHTLEDERRELRTVTAGLEMQVESMLND